MLLFPALILLSSDVNQFKLRSESINIDTTLSLRKLLQQHLSDPLILLQSNKNFDNQRVTLYLKDFDRSNLPQALVRLFSHPGADKEMRPLFEWHRGIQENTFIFTPNSRYNKLVSETKDFSRQAFVQVLKSTRDDLRNKPKYKSDRYSQFQYLSDDSMMSKAITSLTDDQIQRLSHGAELNIEPLINQRNIDLYKKMWQKSIDKTPNGVILPEIPFKNPVLRADRVGKNGSVFNLLIQGAVNQLPPGEMIWNDTGMMVDPYTLHGEWDAYSGQIPQWLLEIPEDKKIDLSDLYKDKSVTTKMRQDSAYILRYVAEKAGINLLCEQFLFKQYDATSARNKFEFTLREGTLRDIFKYIWMKWNIVCCKENDIYYCWSPTWVLDRQSDVPQETIDFWKERYVRQRGFSLSDQISIFSSLSDYQLNQTFFPEVDSKVSSINGAASSHALLRFLGMCSSATLAKARTTEGIRWQDIARAERNRFDFASAFERDSLRPIFTYNFSDISSLTGQLRIEVNKTDGNFHQQAFLILQKPDGSIFLVGTAAGSTMNLN